jgi:hypothetical protein
VAVRVVDGDTVVAGARLVADWLVVVARLAVEGGAKAWLVTGPGCWRPSSPAAPITSRPAPTRPAGPNGERDLAVRWSGGQPWHQLDGRGASQGGHGRTVVPGREVGSDGRGGAMVDAGQEPVQVVAELFSRAVGAIVVACGPEHDRGQLGRHIGAEADRRIGGWLPAGQHGYRAAADSLQVGGRIAAGGRGCDGLGEAKVGHLNSAVDGQQDVGRGEEAMDHAARMRRGQGGAHAGGDPGHPDRRQRPPIGKHVGQAGPLHQLADHKPGTGVRPDRVDGGDVAMAEAGRGSCLAFEPLQERLVGSQAVDQDLEGDAPGPYQPDHAGRTAQRHSIHPRQRSAGVAGPARYRRSGWVTQDDPCIGGRA